MTVTYCARTGIGFHISRPFLWYQWQCSYFTCGTWRKRIRLVLGRYLSLCLKGLALWKPCLLCNRLFLRQKALSRALTSRCWRSVHCSYQIIYPEVSFYISSFVCRPYSISFMIKFWMFSEMKTFICLWMSYGHFISFLLARKQRVHAHKSTIYSTDWIWITAVSGCTDVRLGTYMIYLCRLQIKWRHSSQLLRWVWLLYPPDG